MDKDNKTKEKLESRLSENINEEKVCTWIIIPYLTEVLNWDIEDIHPEYYVHNTGGKKVDYAVGSEKEPEFLVEVKSLGKNLDKCEDQLSRYLDLSDVNYGLLTDGLEYRVMERKESSNNEKIGIYNLTDKPIDKIRYEDDIETDNKSIIEFTNDIKSNIPPEINEKIINPLIVQYGSSKTNIDPIHLYISMDYIISRHFRSFILNSYDELLYIRSYGNKDKEIIKNSKDPSIIIYDNISSDNSISDNTIKNSIDSVGINKSTDLPSDIPLLVINTPIENKINEYDPILEQISIGDFIRHFDLVYTLEYSDHKFEQIIDSHLDFDSIHKLDNKISPIENNKDISNIIITRSMKNKIRSYICDFSDEISYNSLSTDKIQTLEDISKIIAHLDYEDKVDEEHKKLAEKILDDTLSDYLGYNIEDEENEKIPQDDRRNKLKQVIAENEDEGEKGAPKELIIEIMTEEFGFEEDEIEYDLNKLGREGDEIYEPRPKEFAEL